MKVDGHRVTLTSMGKVYVRRAYSKTFDERGAAAKRIAPKIRQALREGHLHAGNCSCDACYERHEDVCPKHDEPRGECSVCERCVACDKESNADAKRQFDENEHRRREELGAKIVGLKEW